MKPAAYFDITAKSREDRGTLAVVNRLMSILHGAIRQMPGRFALAFPQARQGGRRHPGRLIRVFAESREVLDDLVAAIEAHQVVRESAHLGYARSVPADFAGPWREYRRYRIPSRKSRLKRARSMRIEAADEMPYFRLTSRSNEQGFSLYLAVQPGRGPGDCQPDSYGLSVATRPFALPDLPV